MSVKNATNVARFKALVELGKTLSNPVMLGEYTCLQQMKVHNATNYNQCVNPAGTPAPVRPGCCREVQLYYTPPCPPRH
eukprot:COSAG01_NODE_11839_length_1849_cov_1.879429_2_plen_79_part_00